MAYPASHRYTYWAQLAILAGCVSLGFLLATLVSSLPLLLKYDMKSLLGLSPEELSDRLLVPANAGILRLVQFLSTLMLFFLPTLAYARICHRRAVRHLGLQKPVQARQLVLVVLIMFACLPLVGALADLTQRLPFSQATLNRFQAAEDAYNRQVAVIGRMDSVLDFILSLIMLAILPAVFEETLFRGGVQNLLSRWWRAPIWAIVVTSLLFSAVHGSYLGFLSRAVLGFVLGWMYYRTGNLRLNIIAHAVNNTVAITALYVVHRRDPNADLSKADPHFALWWGAVSVIAVVALFVLFERTSAFQVDRPGREVPLPPGEDWPHYPFSETGNPPAA
ncbi:MAG TPA: CPBP family intramembrane glutamic endopeptidase [Chitinophagaceae bacterium]|nr:CPBP family intramembrane glutamic endopeptidase [Chitinophagaceae bacterium]